MAASNPVRDAPNAISAGNIIPPPPNSPKIPPPPPAPPPPVPGDAGVVSGVIDDAFD